MKTLREVELDHIFKVLKDLDWHRTKASKVLGISTRSLRMKINEMRDLGYDIDDRNHYYNMFHAEMNPTNEQRIRYRDEMANRDSL